MKDEDGTGVIDFREYLLGVLGISKARSSLETLKLACKIYDHSGTGTGRLTLQDFTKILNLTLQLCEVEAEEFFYQINRTNMRYITYDQFIQFAMNKAEFADLFSLSKEEKQSRQNGVTYNNCDLKKIK